MYRSQCTNSLEMVPLFPDCTRIPCFIYSQIFAYLIVSRHFYSLGVLRTYLQHTQCIFFFNNYCNCLCVIGNVSLLPVMSPHAPFPHLLIWIQLEDAFVAEYSPDMEGEIRIPVKRIFILIWWHPLEDFYWL